MGGRYWISGVQIGMIKAFLYSNKEDLPKIIDILGIVEDKQFIGKKKDLKEMLSKEK